MSDKASFVSMVPQVGESQADAMVRVAMQMAGQVPTGWDPLTMLALGARNATVYSSAFDGRGFKGIELQIRVTSILGAGQFRVFLESSVDQAVWYPVIGNGAFTTLSHVQQLYPGATTGTGASTPLSSGHVGRFFRARMDHNTGLPGDAVTLEVLGYPLY